MQKELPKRAKTPKNCKCKNHHPKKMNMPFSSYLQLPYLCTVNKTKPHNPNEKKKKYFNYVRLSMYIHLII